MLIAVLIAFSIALVRSVRRHKLKRDVRLGRLGLPKARVLPFPAPQGTLDHEFTEELDAHASIWNNP